MILHPTLISLGSPKFLSIQQLIIWHYLEIVFTEINKERIEVKFYWLWMGPKSSESFFYEVLKKERERENNIETKRQREGDTVKVETDTGMMYWQAKECCPVTRKVWNRAFLRVFWRNCSCQYLDFWLLASRTVIEYISVL